jgi:hypothetical protein
MSIAPLAITSGLCLAFTFALFIVREHARRNNK